MTNDLLRLTRLDFRAPASPGGASVSADLSNVTLLVGPNNSGKSLALREIEQWCTSGAGNFPPQAPPEGRVVLRCNAVWPGDLTELQSFLDLRKVVSPDVRSPFLRIQVFPLTNQMPGGAASGTADIRAMEFEPGVSGIEEHTRRNVLPHFTARLDGRSRFELTQAQVMSNLRNPPGNYLSALSRNQGDREQVRNKVHQAFGLYFAIDSTSPPQLQPVLADTPPNFDENSPWSPEAVAYQSNAQPLGSFSDGVQVYTAIVAAIQSAPYKVVLIDEPEAFLHPTLARRLGRELSLLAKARNASLVAATHSAEFLFGCVTELPESSIVRLTYQGGLATARALPGEAVRRLVADPLLRSSDSLSALFAGSAVICEADADRAFYQEINRRMVQAGRRHVADGVFLNAQNWQTIVKIAAPLRALGIPAAVIVDLDAVAREEAWPEILAMLGEDEGKVQAIGEERRRVGKMLLAAGRVGDQEQAPLACKARRLACLPTEERSEAARFLELLADYGIFVVRLGELENWLSNLGVTNKKTWVTDILTRLGTHGTAVNVTPTDDDVWAFVEAIGSWTESPDRKGMPA